MPLSIDIIEAAQQLGQALHQTETVQTYLDTSEKLESDVCIAPLLAQIEEQRRELTQKELAGVVLSLSDASRYHNLVDQAHRYPLVTQHEHELSEVQFLFAQVSETISSFLSINYTSLVGEE